MFINDIIDLMKEKKILNNEIMIFNDARLLTTIISLLEASVKECQKVIDSNFMQIA